MVGAVNLHLVLYQTDRPVEYCVYLCKADTSGYVMRGAPGTPSQVQGGLSVKPESWLAERPCKKYSMEKK